jgi:diguanylate cyclase (GGDEF)-like protein
MKESLRKPTASQIGKVLAINSDPEIIYILEVNLAHANLEVVSTQTGQEALAEIRREKPDIIILDPTLPDIDGIELCQQLKEAESTSHIPVILITDKAQGNNKIGKIVNIVNYYVTKPFDPKDVVDMVLTYLKQKERAENLSPLTGLPNENQVSAEITRLIERKKTFAAMYVAMNDLKSFNKVYGYDQGDMTIQLLADIIVEAVRLFGNPDDLVGHLGGDKFVILSTPWKARPICRRIIADFNRRIKALYTDQHLQKGYIAYESPLGIEEQSPIMSLRVAVITNQRRTFNHHLEVSEAAAEQMEYLKRFPGNRSIFDFQTSGLKTDALPFRLASSANREEVRAMYGVLTWLDFIIKELHYPIIGMKDCLNSLKQTQTENLNFEQQNSLNIIRENIVKLNKSVEGLTDLTKAEWLTAGAVLEEVDLSSTLNWIIKQLTDVMGKHRIELDIEGIDDVDKLLVDRKKLTQCLLYLLRGEIKSSIPDNKLLIHVAERNEDSISIQLINPDHYIPHQMLSILMRGQQEGVPNNALQNHLYPAKLLAEALGGEMSVTSTKTKGTTYTIIIPKKWQSIMQESNALQLAVDVSRKAARAELRNINQQLTSLTEEVPQEMQDSLERLHGKVQELGVLCNRSLFLAEEFRGRLESQQDRLLQHETEQLASLEAVVAICREIAGSKDLTDIFDLDTAKRVAKHALAIAKEMKLSDSDNQVLYHAALLKDLGLVLSPLDMVEQKVANNLEEATSIKNTFSSIWQALSIVPSLAQTLNCILYRYERYNDKSNLPGVTGGNIPLNSRILAVADTFESMISGRSPYNKLSVKLAVQNIVDDSGLRFDPHVVRTFLTLWKNNELSITPDRSR